MRAQSLTCKRPNNYSVDRYQCDNVNSAGIENKVDYKKMCIAGAKQ